MLSTGRAKGEVLATCARNVVLLIAIFNICLNVVDIQVRK